MKKFIIFAILLSVVGILQGCTCNCRQDPTLEANRSLVVPKNFGNMPTK
ncbi:MAG: hypothetical protein MJ156_02075 [Alphaproteobacteria bacterium]|nr:hypothetical protein [Alphaproteobacteria bacterium]